MRVLQNILILVMLICAGTCAYADGEDSDMFDAATQGFCEDAETGFKKLIQALAGLFALGSALAVLGGWFGHSEKWFMRGLKGCGVIIIAAIVYFVAVGGFNYIVDNYW